MHLFIKKILTYAHNKVGYIYFCHSLVIHLENVC